MNGKRIKKRMLHYDLLRIIAAFSVVMLHSAAQYWYTLDIHSREWIIANSYDAVFRFGVPVFVMISGALFLSSEYELDIRHLYKHNILRFVVLYIVWSCLYGLWDTRNFCFAEVGVKPYLKEMLHGSYHLWFLPMLIGLYMILPMVRIWVHHADRKNLQYFLGLFLVLQVGRETLRAVTMMDEIHYILDITKVEMACSYLGYFVWGYYLAHVGLSQRLCKVIYWLVVPSILLNVVLGNGLSYHYEKAMGNIYDSFGIFTFIVVTGLFLVAQEFFGRKQFACTSTAIIKEVSADTLGIYVMHVGLMGVLANRGIDSMMVPNIIGVPLLAVICFVICMIAAAVLRRIPMIGKFIC
ncbi:MAG: acyltransferase family protein [Lachnospiraceae bacterium]|nr:acyltransferase family protein [Lachnospiraceae bacterium]